MLNIKKYTDRVQQRLNKKLFRKNSEEYIGKYTLDYQDLTPYNAVKLIKGDTNIVYK